VGGGQRAAREQGREHERAARRQQPVEAAQQSGPFVLAEVVDVLEQQQWTGTVHQGSDGLVWHNHYPLDRVLATVRWEAQVVGRLLGTRTAAAVCVHGAHVQGGGLDVQGVAIVPAHLLRGALGYDQVLSDAEVALLATTARTSLRPAA
jgi:hypothetical protein